MKNKTDKKIKDLRIILLVFAVITPLSYYLRTNIETFDPLWIKMLFGVTYVLFFIGTFFVKFIKKYHYLISIFLIYSIIIYQFYLILINNFEKSFTGGYIFFSFLAILYLRTYFSMFFFSIISFLTLLILYIVYKNDTELLTFGHVRSIIIMNGLSTIIRYYGIRKELKLNKYSIDLEASEEKFKNLLEFAPDAIISTDSNGIIKEINKKGVLLFNKKIENIISKNITLFISNQMFENKLFFNELKNNLSENKIIPLSNVYYAIVENNIFIPIELSFGVIEVENKEKNYITIFRDITPRIDAEKELNEMRFKLQQKEISEKISLAKSEFISKMSHEIRTPLNSIYGFTNILLKEKINNNQKKYVETIKFSSELLSLLINDILDNANLETGNISLEENEIDINLLIYNVAESFNIKLNEKKLKLNIKYSEEIINQLYSPIGDKLRISQIIMNLLSNSIKFSHEEGNIDLIINFEEYETSKLKLQIIVKDYGIGIPEEKIKDIFHPYVQVSNEISKKYGGNGLGLSIVKNLIDKMGGSISVESNGCTIFKVELILRKEAKVKNSNTQPNNEFSRLKNIKILIVEDNLMNQFLLQTILDNYSIKYDIAENGKVALQFLENKRYDLILMDLMMPEMDGFTCTKIIKKELKLDCKIIALTADIKSILEKEKQELFDGYLKKPFEEEDLLNSIIKFNYK
ncbi:MAG: response regulator [Flavobacteriia bacterium]|nr:response regulator [Flavobacteriia bacterium]